MRTYCIAFYLAVVLPALAAAPGGGKNDWGRLERLAKTQTVKVQLRDGQVLTGYVQEFRADGLTFVDENKLATIRTRDIESTSLSEAGQVRKIEGKPPFQRGQTVELKMRDGRVRQGTVQQFSAQDERLWLAETSSTLQLDRADIVRVMAKRSGQRARNALIGAAAGGAILWGVARAKSDPRCFEPNAHCTGNPPGVVGAMGAVIGAIGGALFPVKGWTVVYQI